MRTAQVKGHSESTVAGPRYDHLSLVELAERIVASDRAALRELHDARPLFRLENGEPLLLAGFIERLTDTLWARNLAGGDAGLLESACDLTVDKYVLIPKDPPGAPRRGRHVPDCRRAFRSFLRVMNELTADKRAGTPIQSEILAARILQRRVVYAFRLSCLDARRAANRGRSRYAWRVNGRVIYVWMPRAIQNLRRRAWLEENIAEVDPFRPGERYRVQGVIDERLGIAGHVSIEGSADDLASRRAYDSPVHTLIEEEVSAHGLANAVAEEKAANIDSQRRAIRILGRLRLKQLILRIFDNLAQEAYEEKRLAEAFGISRATFTRFAGSRWKMDADGRIPDLWANTAQTLAAHAPLMEAAEEAGVWDNVELILANRKHRQPRSPADV